MPNIQPRHHATLPGSSQKKSPSLIEDLNDGVLQTEIEQMIKDLEPELERAPSSPKVSQTEMKNPAVNGKLLDELDQELDAIGDPDSESGSEK